MTTQTQPWLRAELIAAPETTPGAQLMIPADGIEFHDDQLVFHHQGDIVYVAPQGQLRSITWLAKQPNPATARRRAQWPNHGTRWTDEEREDLLRRLQAGQAWKTISTAHGRSRSGCQQEAVKQGWLDADTLRLKPEFLPAPGPTDPTATAPEAPSPASTPARPDDTVGDTTPVLARHATRSAAPQAPPNAPPPTTDAPHAAAPYVVSRQPPPEALATDALTGRPAPPPHPSDGFPGPHASEAAAAPSPDQPRFPPRIPRQRADPDTLPGPGPEPGSGPSPDSEPGPEAGPRPGTRFLSRAQSSLARATLGAYTNPPRSESGAAPGAT